MMNKFKDGWMRGWMDQQTELMGLNLSTYAKINTKGKRAQLVRERSAIKILTLRTADPLSSGSREHQEIS
jgi:hypothetical protein